MTPICLSCKRTMRCHQNGFVVREQFPFVRSADVFVCRGCGVMIVAGFSEEPWENSALWEAAPEIDGKQPLEQAAENVQRFGSDLAEFAKQQLMAMNRAAQIGAGVARE